MKLFLVLCFFFVHLIVSAVDILDTDGTSCDGKWLKWDSAANYWKCLSVAPTCTALAADPAACGANLFTTDQNASGTLTCTQPAFSNLSGAATDAQVPDTVTINETAIADDLACTGAQSIRRNAGDTAWECFTPAAGTTPRDSFNGQSSASLTVSSFCNLGYDVCGTSATAVLNQTPIPYTGTAKNLRAWTSAAQASGDTCTVRIASGTCNTDLATSAVTCTILDVDQDCSDTSNSVAITAGQCAHIEYVEVGGTCAGNLIWSFEYDPS